MTTEPMWIWIIAGISGSGKSTITGNSRFSEKMPDMPVLNVPDVREALLKKSPDLSAERASAQAIDMITLDANIFIDARQPFILKTALRTDRFRPVVEKARAAGIRVGMVYVGLSNLELAVRRIEARHQHGGQTTTLEELQSTWDDRLDNLTWYATRVDRLLIFCNDHPDGQPVLVAEGRHGKMQLLNTRALPHVTENLLPVCGM